MKKISRYALAAFFIFLIAGSCVASRGGGFYADRKTGVYHSQAHADAQKIDKADKVIFDTPKEAEAAGYKPCELCNPSEDKEDR